MKITVQEGEFTYAYDSHVNDIIEGGFVKEYFPPVEVALDAAISLLWNVYDREEIAKVLLKGIPAMDYAKPEFKQKSAK